jgi:hypothetical protein
MGFLKKTKDAIIDFSYRFEIPEISLRTNKIQKQLLQKQAIKRSGDLRTGISTYLIFLYQGMDVSVRYQVKSIEPPLPEKTLINVKLNLVSDSHAEITRKGTNFIPSIKTIVHRIQNVVTMNPSFDEKYNIKSNEESFVASVIDSKIQTRLLELTDFNPAIEIWKNGLEMTIHQLIYDDEGYDKVIDVVLLLIDNLRNSAFIIQ